MELISVSRVVAARLIALANPFLFLLDLLHLLSVLAGRASTLAQSQGARFGDVMTQVDVDVLASAWIDL